MSQQVIDIDTVGYSNELGGFFVFYVNNTFYLLAPSYYQAFYSIYLNRCLACYDGWVRGFHNINSGLVPQRMLQSIATGLNNMLFAHGIDFSGGENDYAFAVKWAKESKFYKAIKKAHLLQVFSQKMCLFYLQNLCFPMVTVIGLDQIHLLVAVDGLK